MRRRGRTSALLLAVAAIALLTLTGRHLPQATPGAALAARGITPTIQTHPNWPHAWMREAQRLATDGELGTRFDQAVARAVELGRSERRMRQRLALLALRHWQQLSPEGQRLGAENLQFALQTQPRDVLVTAFQLRREALVCGLWKGGGAIVEVCDQQRQLRALCDRPAPTRELVEFCLARGAVPRHPPRS